MLYMKKGIETTVLYLPQAVMLFILMHKTAVPSTDP